PGCPACAGSKGLLGGHCCVPYRNHTRYNDTAIPARIPMGTKKAVASQRSSAQPIPPNITGPEIRYDTTFHIRDSSSRGCPASGSGGPPESLGGCARWFIGSSIAAVIAAVHE